MIKKTGLAFLVICLMLLCFGTGLAQAAGGPAILSSSTQAGFPASLTFKLSAQSDANITDIRLHYQVDRISFAQVTSEVSVAFTPATKVDTQWDWDMRKTGGLPPGTAISYWWTVTDANGKKVDSQTATVQFDDKRYPWRNIVRGQVTLYWYQGDDNFANILMSTAQQVMARLIGDTGARLTKPVRIYIYASAQDLQGSMIFPQEWTGGVTYTEFGIMAIGISPVQIDWGIKTIAHEFTHLIVHQIVLNPYNDLPTWLDEGMAMYNEGALDTQFLSVLNSSIAQNSLISVRSLASPFSAFPQTALLSYAESYSIVKYLIDTYGQAKMTALLDTFRQGSGYDEALQKVYGLNMDILNTGWRSSLIPGIQTKTALAPREKAEPALVGMIAGFRALFLGPGLALAAWDW
ncbi:MAG: peptidase MA family metallohydrolase [Dehalococcoidales bacterium]|nr:peptidase MA family metallohydrolase [Dehalococcoidales bacterium]